MIILAIDFTPAKDDVNDGTGYCTKFDAIFDIHVWYDGDVTEPFDYRTRVLRSQSPDVEQIWRMGGYRAWVTFDDDGRYMKFPHPGQHIEIIKRFLGVKEWDHWMGVDE